MEQTLQAGNSKPMERQKMKPKALNVLKISNGYLVSPQGVYPSSENASTYVFNLEGIARVIEDIFNTEA
mgnify:CR=1 FL=1